MYSSPSAESAPFARRNDTEVVIRNRENEILFIDARTLGDDGANEEGYVLLTDEDKIRISNTLFSWQSKEWTEIYKDIPEFCYSASINEIREKDYTLTPSKYIEFIDHDLGIDYEKEMVAIQRNMRELLQEDKNIQDQLMNAFKGIGYELK